MKKDSFVFHRDWYVALRGLDDAARLEVYDAIMHKVFDDDVTELSSVAQTAMRFIVPQFERDKNKYEQICERRKAFGAKGGLAKASKSYQKVAKASKSYQKVASVADNDNISNDIIDCSNSSNSSSNSSNSCNSIDSKDNNKNNIFVTFSKFCSKFRKFGGRVRGAQTELEDFKKKHKDWEAVVPLLDYAIEMEEKARRAAEASHTFFPRIQNLKTYLSQRSWEAYSEGYDDYNTEDYHPLVEWPFQTWDDKRKVLIFNGDIAHLDDGYTDDDRPGSAAASWGMYTWRWSKERKEWVKQ